MTTKRILLSGLILMLIMSCSKYLDPFPNGDYSDEDIWNYQNLVQGLVGQCYDNMPRNYNDNEGAYLDGATDNAVITSSTNNMNRLASSTMTPSNDAFLTYWSRDYKSIRNVNLFLKDRKGYNTRFIINNHFNDLVKNRLQGEAFALRAWFEWDLLQKFGGKGTNGQMLGFPIIKEPLDVMAEINLQRNTFDECVKQIIADCDSAYKYLPIAHRDYLYPANSPDLVYAGGRYWGRFDGITTRAIKSLVYLTWASPRFNPTNDVSRWDSAASNAKKVIDFKLTKDVVAGNGNSFNPVNQVNWFNPNFAGIVFSSRSNTDNGSKEAMERMFYPGGFQGLGVIGATQELVDAFGMANGRPINDPLSGYNPANPYVGRDPRFYTMIFYNSAGVYKNNTVSAANLMYTMENWSDGGKDVAGALPTNSLTNYHIKKFVYMGLNWSDASINRQPHAKFFIRWAHMVLTFAEAANHVVGANDASKYGLSAKAAIKYLRTRKTYDNTNGISATDPYLDEVALAGEAKFDEFVKNERRIETCFEGIRFHDIRRWSTTLTELNKPVHGVGVVKNANGSFTYDPTKAVGNRVYKSAYLPIPYQEMIRMNNLVQNEGWESWK